MNGADLRETCIAWCMGAFCLYADAAEEKGSLYRTPPIYCHMEFPDDYENATFLDGPRVVCQVQAPTMRLIFEDAFKAALVTAERMDDHRNLIAVMLTKVFGHWFVTIRPSCAAWMATHLRYRPEPKWKGYESPTLTRVNA